MDYNDRTRIIALVRELAQCTEEGMELKDLAKHLQQLAHAILKALN